MWLGLTLGLLFAVLGLTGSVLVFYVEIDHLLHPEIRSEPADAAPGWSSQTWDRALETVRARWPQSHGQWRFEVTGERAAIPARYYGTGGHSHSLMVWLSPDGTRVLRGQTWGRYLVTWIYDLHMNLLAGDTGKKVAGWSGLAMLMLLLTGLAAWWPRGSWAKALAFKRRAAAIRRLHDWHKLSGLWSLPLLTLLVATGVMLALPQERDAVLVRSVGPVDRVPAPISREGHGQRIPIQTALDAAHRALPRARLAWIEVPGNAAAAFRIRVQVPGDPSRRFPHSYVIVDQYTGEVLAVQDARNSATSTTIANWLHPLHDASIGGLGTRILAVVIGLFPAALFITGLMRWLRRRRSARVRSSTHIPKDI